jgi:DNA-binding SARP family transcriptional activator
MHVLTPDGIRGEITRGLVCASQAHYADAAAHFAIAREQLPPTESQLLAALNAFLESNARYWRAEQALHDASHHFVLTSNDQEARLADLQEALAVAGNPTALDAVATLPDPDSQGAYGDASSDTRSDLPGLVITCFGRFEAARDGTILDLCRNRNGQAILRYLAASPHHRETDDALMEALWPDDDLQVARHKLHVAVSALRRALNNGCDAPKGGGYLVYNNGFYQLNPLVPMSIDVDQFERRFRDGQHVGGERAIPDYEAACRLYTGPLLPEDIYADWAAIRREQLAHMHLEMCSALATYYLSKAAYDQAAQWALAVLEQDRCNETAHRQLMRAYAASGRRAQALRQYQRCERILADELGVQPMPLTTELFHAIVQGDSLPAERMESP